MSTATATIPPALAQIITGLNDLDVELAKAKGEHGRLGEAEKAIVDRLERLADAGNDRERNAMPEELLPLLPGADLPVDLGSTDAIAALALIAGNELQRLGGEMDRVETEIQGIADRRDRTADEFARQAQEAIRQDPAIVPAIRSAMGLPAIGGRA